jgi:hypothetical protein
MIRDLTKSVLSFSWALSLLGVKQSVNLIQPGQQGRENAFAPLAQAASEQLDESVKGLFRTGEKLQHGMVDMAFSLLNPAGWVNPGTWSSMAGTVNPGNWMGGNGAAGSGIPGMMNPMNWMNPANFMRSMSDRAPFTGQPPTSQPYNPPPSQPSAQATSASVPNESASGGWGPMPSDS